MGLTNAKMMIEKAAKGKYAVAHINTNNLEWTKAILTTAQETNSPIILATSEGAVTYFGGYRTCHDLVAAMIADLKITVPIALHLDHGTYEGAKAALAAGYTSVMFDGSHLPFEENLTKSKEIIKLAKAKNASVEVELGTLEGEEDGVQGSGARADAKEVDTMGKTGVDFMAVGINNLHGPYPANWTGLDFKVLTQLAKVGKVPFVLHGGTGIPTDQIKKSISLGVAKINVNTELQMAFADATRKFVRSGKSDEGKNYDPRKFLNPGYLALKEHIKEKLTIFGSLGKA